jgi:hypothetical protein
MYLLYKITNTINNKCYIGVTSRSLEARWKCHKNTAFKKKASYKFSNALRKYGTDCWTKEILFSNIPENEIEQLEIDTIAKYNSCKEGYNTSLGGKIPKGIICKKGKNHHSTDRKIYNFYNKDGRMLTSTIHFFAIKEKVVKANAQSTFSRKQFIFGWTNDYSLLLKWKNKNRKKLKKVPTSKPKTQKVKVEKPQKVLKVKVEKTPLPKKEKSLKVYTLYNTFGIPFTGSLEWLSNITFLTTNTIRYILHSNTSFYKWTSTINPKPARDRTGENNPMFGKTRPDNVKNAVRNRVRNSADPTLRNWVHEESGTIEYNIRSLDLRDKYNLNISHLKRITDKQPKYKTHKGWKLYETSD